MKLSNLKYYIIAISLISCGRAKDYREIVWNDYVFEENGIYYSINCSTHSNYKKYTGCDTVYHDNRKIRGISNVVNGMPEGHWIIYDTTGRKTIDMHFKKGVLINKN